MAAVLISFGGIIGKVTPVQLLWLCAIECVFYAINWAICFNLYQITDSGGSIVIHIFGAFARVCGSSFSTWHWISFDDIGLGLTVDAGSCMGGGLAGAYFGLACNQVVTLKRMSADGLDKENRNQYIADLFSLLGTLFLFLYWPSFKYVRRNNGILARGVPSTL